MYIFIRLTHIWNCRKRKKRMMRVILRMSVYVCLLDSGEKDFETSSLVLDRRRLYFLSLATYLNCFLIGAPSISWKWKVLVAEVERPRHFNGFQRPGAVHTVFMLGALIFSTVFLTASRRSMRAE